MKLLKNIAGLKNSNVLRNSIVLRNYIGLIGIWLCFSVSAAIAEDNTAVGTVDDYRPLEGEIVLGDLLFRLPVGLKIEDERGNPVSSSKLKLGTSVEFSWRESGQWFYVEHIKILPNTPRDQ